MSGLLANLIILWTGKSLISVDCLYSFSCNSSKIKIQYINFISLRNFFINLNFSCNALKFSGLISSCWIISPLYLGAAKLVVAVAVFLLTFYVISQVFEIKMDASLGNLFGKFHFFPFLKFYFRLVVCKLLPVINIESLCCLVCLEKKIQLYQ